MTRHAPFATYLARLAALIGLASIATLLLGHPRLAAYALLCCLATSGAAIGWWRMSRSDARIGEVR